VPDGEPTLDRNLGRHLAALKPFGVKTAVITNASLLCDKEVRSELLLANWVSVKVDTVREATWRALDRPHRGLDWERHLNA
jgi:wyosine [tRNA(Phe)-imidazoG37] synthetase (radical SAM superfamily)